MHIFGIVLPDARVTWGMSMSATGWDWSNRLVKNFACIFWMTIIEKDLFSGWLTHFREMGMDQSLYDVSFMTKASLWLKNFHAHENEQKVLQEIVQRKIWICWRCVAFSQWQIECGIYREHVLLMVPERILQKTQWCFGFKKIIGGVPTWLQTDSSPTFFTRESDGIHAIENAGCITWSNPQPEG